MDPKQVREHKADQVFIIDDEDVFCVRDMFVLTGSGAPVTNNIGNSEIRC